MFRSKVKLHLPTTRATHCFIAADDCSGSTRSAVSLNENIEHFRAGFKQKMSLDDSEPCPKYNNTEIYNR